MRKFSVFILSLFGLFDSIYLWWVYASPSHPLVCIGTGCDVARASSYSHLWGLPLPLYGAVMYGALTLLAFGETLGGMALSPVIRYVTLIISAAGLIVSVGLMGIEAFILHAWCAWCVASAITVALILLLSIYGVARPPASSLDAQALAAARGQFVIFVVALIAGSIAFVHLAHSGELAPPKPVSMAKLEQYLVRPDSHATGNLHSPVTVVEFGDFECPICGLAQKTVERMLNQYGTRIRFVFRQFPLTAIHPQAEKAAEASECAAEQGKFWQADKLFYQKQSDLSVDALKRYARDLGLNTSQFDACLTSGRMAGRVQQDVADGKMLGLNWTPTFFVGNHAIYGPPNYADLSAMLNEDLARAQVTASKSTKTQALPPPQKSAAKGAAPAPSSSSTPSSSPQTSSSNLNPNNPFGGGVVSALQASSPLACSPDEAKLEQPTLIRTPEAKELFNSTPKPLFVDVRSPQDFAAGHIPGAINIPVEDIAQKWTVIPKDKVIVFYEGGERGGSPDDVCAFSRAAGRVVLSHGFDKVRVKVYQDGLKGWKVAGLPVQK